MEGVEIKESLNDGRIMFLTKYQPLIMIMKQNTEPIDGSLGTDGSNTEAEVILLKGLNLSAKWSAMVGLPEIVNVSLILYQFCIQPLSVTFQHAPKLFYGENNSNNIPVL